MTADFRNQASFAYLRESAFNLWFGNRPVV